MKTEQPSAILMGKELTVGPLSKTDKARAPPGQARVGGRSGIGTRACCQSPEGHGGWGSPALWILLLVRRVKAGEGYRVH